MAHILLAGCGKLGEALGTLLQQQGHQVTGIRRSKVEMPFPCLQMDLTQPESIHLPQQVDYVVYTTTPSERSDQGYQQAYVNALTHLLDALQDKPVKHFFFVSSTAVYHQNDGSWVDENSPTQPPAFNGKRVLEGEQLAGQCSIPSTCVRFGGIYSPQRNWLIRRVQKGADIQITPPKYTNRIHQDDCIGLLAFLIGLREQGQALSPCYVAVDDAPASEEEIYNWLAQALNAPKPQQKSPKNTDTPNNPVNQNKRCSNALIKALGYTFLYPSYKQGYQHNIDTIKAEETP